MLKRTALAAALGATLIPGAALAQSVSPEGQKILEALEPEARQYIMSRMGPDQTVRGLVETTILNRLQQEYAAVERMTYVPEEEVWVVVLVDEDGARRAHHIDYTMLDQFYQS